jgi:hypothetical protein
VGMSACVGSLSCPAQSSGAGHPSKITRVHVFFTNAECPVPSASFHNSQTYFKPTPSFSISNGIQMPPTTVRVCMPWVLPSVVSYQSETATREGVSLM